LRYKYGHVLFPFSFFFLLLNFGLDSSLCSSFYSFFFLFFFFFALFSWYNNSLII
jgi:hypothetical protein